MNAEERIQFAVRFAEVKLNENRPGDWMNLRDDCAHFLGIGPDDDVELRLSESVYVCAIPNKDYVSDAELLAVQADVRKLLASFADAPRRDHRKAPDPASRKPIPINIDYRVIRIRTKEQGEVSQIILYGTLRDCLLGVLMHLLVQQPGTRLESCPQCGRVFYRQGKQLFCGRTCTNRAMMHRKRKRDREKEQAHTSRAPAQRQTRKPKPGSTRK